MANEFKVKKGLIVHGSGSAILDVRGSQGQLFSVTDSLSGSLFSVGDISGVPIMDVRSDAKIGIGTSTPAEKLHVYGGNVLISGSSADTTLKVQDGANGAPITLRSNGSSECFILLSTNSSIQRTGGDLNFFANAIDMKFSTNNGSTGTLFLDTSHNATFGNDIYGKSVNNDHSKLYRFGGLFLTWDSDSYGTNLHHSITSTDNGSYSDSITINSFDKVRINIDSNDNDSASTFSIGQHSTGTGGTLLTLDGSGDLTLTGHIILPSAKYLEFSGQGKLINMDVAAWSNASEHNLLYAGWESNIGDYLSFKVPGNGTTNHGNLIIGDNLLSYGRMDATNSAQATDSATNPHGDDQGPGFLVTNTGNATFAGSVKPSGNAAKDLGGASNRWATVYAANINTSTSSTFGHDIVLDDNVDHSPEIQWINQANESWEMYNNSSGKFQIEQAGTSRIELSSGGLELKNGGGIVVSAGASDQNSNADTAAIPATTGAEFLRIQHPSYTNGQYTTEFAKIDRSGNLPVYVRQSKATANSFSNLVRFGDHDTNNPGAFAVFGDMEMDRWIIHGGDIDTKFGFSAANTFKVHTGGSDRFSVTGDVHVLGSTDFAIPAGRKLYLDGQSNTYLTETSDGVIDFYGDGVQLFTVKQNGTQNEVIVNEGSGDVDFRVEANNDANAFFVEAEGTGTVGIGTNNPGAKLDVFGTNAAIWINPADGAHAGLHFRQAGTFKGFVGYNDSADVVNFGMDGSIVNGINVNASHNVGIGTTTPTAKLTVEGSGSTILDVQGSQGQLFSVSDQLTGSLFKVADISGIPVFEAFDDDRVIMGAYGQNTLYVKGSSGLGSGSVGINTAPSHLNVPLHVVGVGTSAANIRIGRDDGISTGKSITFVVSSTVDANIVADANKITLQPSSSQGGQFEFNKSGAVKFSTYGSGTHSGTAAKTLAVDSSGNVIEISNSSGADNLGNHTATTTLNMNSNSINNVANIDLGSSRYIRWGAGDAKIEEGDTANYSLDFFTYDGSSLSKAFTLLGNNNATFTGNVGIGTTSPSSKLHLFRNDTSTNELLIENDGTGDVALSFRSDNNTDGNNFSSIYFDANDEGNNNTRYAKIRAFIEDNAAGAEDGKLVFTTLTGASDVNQLILDSSGATFAGDVVVSGTNGLKINTTSDLQTSAERFTLNGLGVIRNSSDSAASLYIQNHSTTANTIQPYIFLSDNGGNRGGLGVETSTAIMSVNGQGGLKFQTGASGVGGTEALLIDNSQNAKFASKVGIAGKAPTYGINLPQGTGVNNKIAWTDSTPNFRASMWANSSDDTFRIATANASSAETVALQIDSSQDALFSGDVKLGGDTNAFAAKIYKKTVTINGSSLTTVATVAGNNLSSAIRLVATGTSGNVVISTIADIIVNHSQDILIKTTNTFYRKLTIKIISNNNEDFAIQLKRDGDTTNDTNVQLEITPLNSEVVTFTNSHSFTGASLEHLSEYGTKLSSNDNNANYHDLYMQDNARLYFGNAPDFELKHNSTTNVNHISSKLDRQLSINANIINLTNQANNNTIATVSGSNFGVGTTTPDGKLEVAGGTTLGLRISNAGDSSAYDQTRITYSGYNSGAPEMVFMPLTTPGSGTVNTFFRFRNTNGANATNNTANVSIDGKLGIGTDNPAAKLHLLDSGQTELRIASSTANTNSLLSFYEGSLGSWGIDAGQANGLFYIKDLYNSNAIRFSINASGKVGIGVDSSGNRLQVKSGGADDGIYLVKSDSGNLLGGVIQTGSGDGALVARNTSNNQVVLLRGNGNSYINGGNLGIGTSSPGGKLTVQDDTAGSPTRIIVSNGGTVQSGTAARLSFYEGTIEKNYIERRRDGSGDFAFVSPSDDNPFVFENASGEFLTFVNSKVGIGTSNPGHLLEVRGTGDAVSIGNDTNTSSYIRFANTRGFVGYTGADMMIQAGSGKNLRLGVNNNSFNSGTAMYIKSDGNVGIGTTSPTEALAVNGNIETSGNTGGLKIGFNVGDTFSFNSTTVAHYGMSNAGNATAGGVVLSGYFGIRFASQGNIRGHISQAGLLTMANDVVAFGSPSDKSLKENIKPINNALDKVKNLKGVTFKWKEAGLTNLKEDIGFIAQDVQEVLPELVRENEDGKLSLRDKGIIPMLVEAVKELSAEVESLKKQLNK